MDCSRPLSCQWAGPWTVGGAQLAALLVPHASRQTGFVEACAPPALAAGRPSLPGSACRPLTRPSSPRRGRWSRVAPLAAMGTQVSAPELLSGNCKQVVGPELLSRSVVSVLVCCPGLWSQSLMSSVPACLKALRTPFPCRLTRRPHRCQGQRAQLWQASIWPLMFATLHCAGRPASLLISMLAWAQGLSCGG